MSDLWINIVLFLIGFVFLTGGAEFLVRGASRLALRLNVPATVIGLTVVAFGTSLPELLVSLIANLRPDGAAIAIGNVVGSNIANMGLILGVAALLAVIPVERTLLRWEYPMMLLASLLFAGMAWNGIISRWEGLILLVGLAGFTYFSYTADRLEPEQGLVVGAKGSDPRTGKPSTRPFLDGLLVLVGIGGLLLGATWLVTSAQFLARAAGISELVIGLTLVALGTSLPELAITVVAVLRKEGDIAVGNVVGSNLFNILAIVSITALVKPLPVPTHMMGIDFPVMFAFSLVPFLLLARPPHHLSRWIGVLLLGGYLVYIIGLFVANGPG